MNLFTQDIIVQDQDGQNNNTLSMLQRTKANKNHDDRKTTLSGTCATYGRGRNTECKNQRQAKNR